MEEFQKRNIYRALAELTNFMVIAMAYSILNSKWKDDDKDYWQYFLLYQLRRLQTEVGVMTPTPYVLDEGMKIIQSPAAAVNWADNLLGILNF